MRVLFTHSGNLFGGIETALVSLAHAVRRQSRMHASYALCFGHGRAGDDLRAAGALVHDLGPTRLSRPWSIWRARRRLRDVIASFRPDVCVTPSAWTQGLFAPVARAHGVPLALWAHDLWSSDHWLDRWALRSRPDMLIANSRYTADGMTQLLAGLPTRVVYCPLEPPAAEPGARTEIRRSLETPDDAVVIVQVARLEPYKGHGVLIDALTGLPASVDWRCWFVGGAQRPHEVEYLAQLRRAADDAGLADRVRFAGSRSDVTQILEAADVFCHPNTGPEPFGLVFVEALRAGLPVVGTSLGGVPEIVTDECGRLVQAGDVLALTAALQELLTSRALRESLGARGPARAALLCDADARLADLTDALSGIATTPGPR